MRQFARMMVVVAVGFILLTEKVPGTLLGIGACHSKARCGPGVFETGQSTGQRACRSRVGGVEGYTAIMCLEPFNLLRPCSLGRTNLHCE